MTLNLLVENIVRDTINEIIVKKMRGINSSSTGYGCGLPLVMGQNDYENATPGGREGWVAIPRLTPVGLLAKDMGAGPVYLFDFHHNVLQSGNKIVTDTNALYFSNRCNIRVFFNKGRFYSFVFYEEDTRAANKVEKMINPSAPEPQSRPRAKRGRKGIGEGRLKQIVLESIQKVLG